MSKSKTIRHIAGELVDDVQRCVICGVVLSDYRDADFIGQKPKGWKQGVDVYVQPGIMSTVEFGSEVENCKKQ